VDPIRDFGNCRALRDEILLLGVLCVVSIQSSNKFEIIRRQFVRVLDLADRGTQLKDEMKLLLHEYSLRQVKSKLYC